jgi:hypothetical protein
MDTKYITRGLFKFAAEDDFEQGELPGTEFSSEIDYDFVGSTADEVINKIAEFLDVDEDAIERNACDEDGRVDFSKLEDADSASLSKSEMELWEKGQLKAWAAFYTAYVEKLERVRV